MSTESTLGDSEEIERLTQLNEELNSTNNRLAMEIDSRQADSGFASNDTRKSENSWRYSKSIY